ncbi:hypothetical protein NLI96_g9277 [Meripilus lineatus]|uniref:Uncharacterized protein n=1 Tax=Meripilus lineatus TaxID=2056292 RepID=A0AAD5UVX9_9APHY|nr:hypothetical protein NLI96_g9277 [Physisporinus lineatus]
MAVPTEFKIAFIIILVLDAAVIGLSAYAGAPATQDRVYSDGTGPVYPIMLLIAKHREAYLVRILLNSLGILPYYCVAIGFLGSWIHWDIVFNTSYNKSWTISPEEDWRPIDRAETAALFLGGFAVITSIYEVVISIIQYRSVKARRSSKGSIPIKDSA